MFNMPFNPYMVGSPMMQQQSAYNSPQMGMGSGLMNYANQQQQSAPAVLYAPTAKDFASVSLQPGKQALIIAQNEPFMAFKSADNMGMVQTTMYRIEQVNEQDISAPSPEYATKAEFSQLEQVVQKITDYIKAGYGIKKDDESK